MIPTKVKEKIFETVICSAMLYGLETVALTERQEVELEVVEIKMLHFSVGVTRLDRVRIEHIT